MFGNKFDGMAAYKYGPQKYKRYKRERIWKRPYKVIGVALEKACEYQKRFIKFVLNEK